MKNLHKYTKMNKQLDYLNVAWEISPESEISPITFSPIQVYSDVSPKKKDKVKKKYERHEQSENSTLRKSL